MIHFTLPKNVTAVENASGDALQDISRWWMVNLTGVNHAICVQSAFLFVLKVLSVLGRNHNVSGVSFIYRDPGARDIHELLYNSIISAIFYCKRVTYLFRI